MYGLLCFCKHISWHVASDAHHQLVPAGKVQELLSILQDQEVANISTFEFLTSGAVQQLKDYLTGADLLKGKGKTYMDSHKLLQRLHAFCEAATSQCYKPGQKWRCSYALSGKSI